MCRYNSSFDPRSALFVVTSPSTAILFLGTKRGGAKSPARSLSYSSSSR